MKSLPTVPKKTKGVTLLEGGGQEPIKTPTQKTGEKGTSNCMGWGYHQRAQNWKEENCGGAGAPKKHGAQTKNLPFMDRPCYQPKRKKTENNHCPCGRGNPLKTYTKPQHLGGKKKRRKHSPARGKKKHRGKPKLHLLVERTQRTGEHQSQPSKERKSNNFRQ